ncbi:DUF4235 domain-containing protein [Arthrobacter sp. SDTb3-6]|uniref:DUF4235 domain-containing protein n=1 Tax=Arthrobacter sp. SDTb3-6 TaxID=2713571 RepID=UPI00159E91A9|nr:DUF4235 domain-containing protein [Arthrobacter sp. SDTb3-6]NVM98711.1 DUF4235 domain-containing protein [Arthrobacter sp. SDTb3-6]
MTILIKVLSMGAALAAGAAVRKALEAGWRKGAGTEPPKDAGNLKNPLPGVIAFALATAVSGAVIQVVTKRLGRKAILRLERGAADG